MTLHIAAVVIMNPDNTAITIPAIAASESPVSDAIKFAKINKQIKKHIYFE